MRRVNLLVYPNAEVLDICGPYEVFATARAPDGTPLFSVTLIGERSEPIPLIGGLKLLPDRTFVNAPPCEVLLIPGGAGRREQCNNHLVVDWLQRSAAQAEVVMSICTGAFLLAKAGLLDGHEVTTHSSTCDELATSYPACKVQHGERFVDQGRLITAGGIAAGIDASLHLVSRLAGKEVAEATARRMEYRWVKE